MHQSIAHLALLVRDYDEAIAFYVGKLGFALIEDRDVPEQGKRWVLLAPPGAAGGTSLLLARAANEEQRARVGDQAAGRVFLFLSTDDFARDHARLSAAGVRFVREPMQAPYGVVAVFEDLYGNRWDLIEYRDSDADTSVNAHVTRPDSDWRVRAARRDDAEAIGALAAQLGYPASAAQIEARLQGMAHSGEHAVLVATRDECVLAWLHVAVTRALEYAPCAEILGLVVDDAARRSGAGAALVSAAESWARAHHLDEIRVRSRVTREDAHRLYRGLGYAEWKQQAAFRKRLGGATSD
jgi:catechol 2,3-dioxygenase-like lactoylglutathione lyase family enzyme